MMIIPCTKLTLPSLFSSTSLHFSISSRRLFPRKLLARNIPRRIDPTERGGERRRDGKGKVKRKAFGRHSEQRARCMGPRERWKGGKEGVESRGEEGRGGKEGLLAQDEVIQGLD